MVTQNKKSSTESLVELYQEHLKNPRKTPMTPHVFAGGVLAGKILKDEFYKEQVELGFGFHHETNLLLELIEDETLLKEVALRYFEDNNLKYPTLIEATFFRHSNENKGIVGMVLHPEQLKEGIEPIPLETEWYDTVTNKTYKVKSKNIKFR